MNVHCEQFLIWCVFQGITMILQNRYQRRRMYTRIALGKNSNMDIVAGESCGTSGQLLALLPFLFGAYEYVCESEVGARATFPS